MNEQNGNERPFDLLSQEQRVARTARMLDENKRLEPNQRTDIVERFKRFIEEHGYTQIAVARAIGLGTSTVSALVRLQYKGKTADSHLVKIHNWMELTARRDNLVHNREFVITSVAREIIQVANTVADTCKMGAIYGPAHIGKTMTLASLVGDQRLGDPILITVDDSTVRPFALCRTICDVFKLSSRGTYDRVFHRLIERVRGTKRLLMFDEADLAIYRTLEMIRQLHDATGCPVLFAGKPAIYEHLGFRHLGEFSERLDQMGARIIISRDLTARTRCHCGNPERGKCTCSLQPLFSREDIRKLIKKSDLKLHVSPDAEKWLQERAGTLGLGGIGNALACLYLAYRIVFMTDGETITAEHLEDVAELTMGHEDAARIAEVVAESSGMRRVV